MNRRPILTITFGKMFYLSTDKIDANAAREGTEVMMKKLVIIIFICTLIYSCGKKGDPIYDENEESQNSKKIISANII